MQIRASLSSVNGVIESKTLGNSYIFYLVVNSYKCFQFVKNFMYFSEVEIVEICTKDNT